MRSGQERDERSFKFMYPAKRRAQPPGTAASPVELARRRRSAGHVDDWTNQPTAVETDSPAGADEGSPVAQLEHVVDEEKEDTWRAAHHCADDEYRLSKITRRIRGKPGMPFFCPDSGCMWYYEVQWSGHAELTIEPMEAFPKTHSGRWLMLETFEAQKEKDDALKEKEWQALAASACKDDAKTVVDIQRKLNTRVGKWLGNSTIKFGSTTRVIRVPCDKSKFLRLFKVPPKYARKVHNTSYEWYSGSDFLAWLSSLGSEPAAHGISEMPA